MKLKGLSSTKIKHLCTSIKNLFHFNFAFVCYIISRVRGNLWIQDVEEENEEDFYMKTNEIRQYIDEKSV